MALGGQHGHRHVVGAPLAAGVGDGHLEGVLPLLKPTELQQAWVAHLGRGTGQGSVSVNALGQWSDEYARPPPLNKVDNVSACTTLCVCWVVLWVMLPACSFSVRPLGVTHLTSTDVVGCLYRLLLCDCEFKAKNVV